MLSLVPSPCGLGMRLCYVVHAGLMQVHSLHKSRDFSPGLLELNLFLIAFPLFLVPRCHHHDVPEGTVVCVCVCVCVCVHVCVCEEVLYLAKNRRLQLTKEALHKEVQVLRYDVVSVPDPTNPSTDRF